MESIKDRVAIVGMGCSKFGERWDAGAEDLLVESCYEAFADAGIEPKDIQAAWLGSSRLSTGQPLAHALKTQFIPITRVENACATGTDAIMNASYAVAAGIYDLVLVAGVEKLKDTGVGGLGGGGEGQPSARIAPPVGPASSFAQVANRYFHQYGLSYTEGKRLLAMISVKSHHNGSMNPKAHFQREITIEQAINAPMMAYPLGLYDCCGVSDGSAAAILTRPDIAKNFRDDYILVKGFGLTVSSGAQWPEHYDRTHFDETVIASRMAYENAGIKNPREEVDLAVVHDCFSISELIIYEDMGWSPRGRAREDIECGFYTLDGGLPVGTDGGLKCFGHPIGASGIRMVYEVYKQLQGKAGPRQVKNPRFGLTHNLGGSIGLTCAVSIWGPRD